MCPKVEVTAPMGPQNDLLLLQGSGGGEGQRHGAWLLQEPSGLGEHAAARDEVCWARRLCFLFSVGPEEKTWYMPETVQVQALFRRHKLSQ